MFNVTAIVLRAFMFSDTKMMVDVLSREEGRLSCVLCVGKSPSARGRRQLFQPLSILELALKRKSSGQLAVVRDAHIAVAFSGIPFHPYKLSISMFLAEFLCNATRAEQDSPLLFDYVRDSLLWLDGVDGGFSNFHLVFMMRFTRFVGFYPNLDDYSPGCCFDLMEGCFIAPQAARRGILGAGDTRKLQLLMRMGYETMHLFAMSRDERNRCLDVILEYYSLHVPDFREMKSLAVLREMFC